MYLKQSVCENHNIPLNQGQNGITREIVREFAKNLIMCGFFYIFTCITQFCYSCKYSKLQLKLNECKSKPKIGPKSTMSKPTRTFQNFIKRGDHPSFEVFRQSSREIREIKEFQHLDFNQVIFSNKLNISSPMNRSSLF